MNIDNPTRRAAMAALAALPLGAAGAAQTGAQSGTGAGARTLVVAAVTGVDAVVFTHGSRGGKPGPEAVDDGAVRNVLSALAGRRVHIALMTAIGVTKHTEGHDWKRRGERLVRASGMPYTIVRPGWFDYNDDDQQQLVLLQGDRRHASAARNFVE